MVLSASNAIGGCNPFVRTVRGGNLLRNLWRGMVGTTLVLLTVGICHGTARAQLTIDDPNGIGSTIVAGIDGNNVVGAYTDSMMNDHGFVYDGHTFKPL